MVEVIEQVYSPFFGKIEKILIKPEQLVYEWEKLFIIQTTDGTIEEVSVGISGYVTSLDAKPGQTVTPQTILAEIEDDFLITGCD
ncbi:MULTISPECIES: hypothetical protein [Fictibacillus]|uniref:Biotin-dependent enzyme n=1 Tax=Fictibacillus terranigra TaxID=3058424 RepID=A0ABT8EAV4_9BACL|nr:hypothetical protein [Fictibacillus sp. CENA-BCM004]MDN4075038.1 hypothetical protein [Fictibacillus sp. CENA-BCM004]